MVRVFFTGTCSPRYWETSTVTIEIKSAEDEIKGIGVKDMTVEELIEELKNLDLSQYLGHDLWEFFRDSSGWVSHRFDQPSNQNRLTADRSDEVEALWKSRKKNVGGS